MILVQLHLNLWNHRETLDNHLRKILACLPNLEVFEFIGKLKDSVTIFTMCCQIKIGTCGKCSVISVIKILMKTKYFIISI